MRPLGVQFWGLVMGLRYLVGHTFSAFWLRSSVVSVLNCVNAVTALIEGLTIHTNFLWVMTVIALHLPPSQSP